MEIYLAQIIGIVAVIFFISSILFSKKNKILLYQLIANSLYFFQYILLGATSAASMNLISALRCYVFKKYDEKKKDIPLIYLIIFISLIILFGLLNYKGLFSLIPMIITTLYVTSSYQKNTKILRYVFLMCSVVWFYYNYEVEAYVSLVGNIFEFVFGLISIIKYRNQK